LPGLYLATAVANGTPLGANTFTLDGRWLRAFNGSGVGSQLAATGFPKSYYGNFRFNGQNPNAIGMDEDYDACDLENWFLALQSADGQVMIPSFHRPGIIRVDPNGVGGAVANDWLRVNPLSANNAALAFVDSAARILRPCQADGHDQATFPDLLPNTTT